MAITGSGCRFVQAIRAAGGRSRGFESKLLHVWPILPALGVARSRWVPEMVGAGPAKDRPNIEARPNKPDAKFIVLAAPAGELLVEAVDGLIIAPPNAKSAAVQLGSARMPHEGV